MATFPGGVWARYAALVDTVSYWTAAMGNEIADEVVALETYLVSTTRTENTFFSGPTTAPAAAPTWRAIVAADLPAATEGAQGALEIATAAETHTGTDDVRAITPLKLATEAPTTPAADYIVRLDASGHLNMPEDGQIYIVGTAANASAFQTTYSTSLTEQPYLWLRKSHQATVGNTATITTENLGAVVWRGNDGSGFTNAAGIRAIQNGAAGSYTPADLVFYTSPGTGDIAEAGRITKDGHLVMAASHDINLANGRSIGIDSSNERVEFYTAGVIALMGAQVGIGTATANANVTTGVTIDQGAADDEAINVRSSDVGAVRSEVETNTYFRLQKTEGGSGGVDLRGYKDADGAAAAAFRILGLLAEDANTTKTSAGRAIVEAYGFQTDGTDLANTVADGNVFAVLTRRGGSTVTVLIVDEDADMDLPSGRIATSSGDYWDLGDYTGGAPTADGYVEVTINGTTYQLLANLP